MRCCATAIQGAVALRSALQAYLWRVRGIHCAPEQIVIVNGSQQGLDLCARLLLDTGDPFLIENPGYLLARQAFAAAGGVAVPVPVDRDGLKTASLPPARLAYVTPSHQFPLGGVLSARRTLLDWASQTGAYVIEDDYDGEYRHDIAPIPPLQTLDPGLGHLCRHAVQNALADAAARLPRHPRVPMPCIQRGEAADRPAHASDERQRWVSSGRIPQPFHRRRNVTNQTTMRLVAR